MFVIQKQYFAFNIWDFDSIQAVMDAANACGCGVILQTSSRIFEHMEQPAIRFFVTYYAKKTGIKAYLHLDHCRKPEVIQQAVDAGWDSVMFDASHLPLDKNIALTNQITEYAHAKGALVEAEVGQIRGVEDDIAVDAEMVAQMSDVKRFLAQTDVDMFAAAIGTCHGLYKSKPNIHYDMIEQIGGFSDKPFVVHGGSGLTDDDFRHLLSYENVKKINVSTELKQAYRTGIEKAEAGGLMAPVGFEATEVKQKIYGSIRAVAEHKMCLLREISV